MKTVEIVQNLLEFALRNEFDKDGLCLDCKAPGKEHEENCKFLKTKKAAEEYLKLMQVPVKE